MKPVDQQAREAAATDLDTTFFVEAAAGTGKTTSLVARILSAVTQRRARLHEIVAITFTEKAAGELKMRVREQLEKQLGGDALCEALGDLERAHISTIHSFCAWILRERPVEAALDPQVAVADEIQTKLLLQEAWRRWLESELSKNPPALRRALMLDVRLEQLEELASLLVTERSRLAGARWPQPQPLDVNAPVRQLQAAAPALQRCLKHFVAREENACRRAHTLLEVLPQLERASADRAIAVLTGLELSEPRRKSDFDSEEAYAETKKLIKELKAVLGGFAEVAGANFLAELMAWLREFVAYFQEFKRERAVLDFDDLLLKTRELLRDNDAVRAELQRRFKFLLVDEFQDTDPVQMEIVLYLAGQQPGKLFVVGDPKQSIYSFRGADIEMYAAARRKIERQGRQLVFCQNFRSKSTILDWVNAVFGVMIQKPGDGDYQPGYIPLAASEGLRTDEARVTVLRPKQLEEKIPIAEARRAEATAIARYLKEQTAAGTFRCGDVAVLLRSFTAVEVFCDALLEHGLPYRVLGGKGYYQRQEIQTLSSLLCCLDNPADKLNLIAVLRSPLFGWTDELIFVTSAGAGLDYLRAAEEKEPPQVRQSFALLRELHEQRHQCSVAGFIERVYARAKLCEAFFACGPDGAQSVANLLKALELARQLEAAGLHSVRSFVRHLRETVLGGIEEEPSPAAEETEDVIRILSIHKSKGLEFPVVVLADLAGSSSDSGVKLLFSRSGNTVELRFAGWRTAGFDAASAEQKKREQAEEIRLLYVAATRAKERLVIPWFKQEGERIDLLRRGFEPVGGKLVEAPDVDTLGGKPAGAEAGSQPVRTSEWIARRRAWQSARAELLKRAAQPLRRISPSGLAGEPEAREEQPAGLERERAMELGAVVHAALERMDAGIVAASALSEDEKRRAVAMVERALRSELLARAGKAEEVYRELPFTMATGDGLMEGRIDLLFCERGKWVLVDYKTDAQVEAQRYAQQMRTYAAALKELAGIEVGEKLLFFLASATVERVDG